MIKLRYDMGDEYYDYYAENSDVEKAIERELKFASKEDLIDYIMDNMELDDLVNDFETGIKELLQHKAEEQYKIDEESKDPWSRNGVFESDFYGR